MNPWPAPGSFFHLAAVTISDQPCQGTAGFVARYRTPDRWSSVEPSKRDSGAYVDRVVADKEPHAVIETPEQADDEFALGLIIGCGLQFDAVRLSAGPGHESAT